MTDVGNFILNSAAGSCCYARRSNLTLAHFKRLRVFKARLYLYLPDLVAIAHFEEVSRGWASANSEVAPNDRPNNFGESPLWSSSETMIYGDPT